MSGRSPSAGIRTPRAAAATAASGEAPLEILASIAYGSERRSIAFSASWMAMCTMAYIRDSCSGLTMSPAAIAA